MARRKGKLFERKIIVKTTIYHGQCVLARRYTFITQLTYIARYVEQTRLDVLLLLLLNVQFIQNLRTRAKT